MRKLKLEFTESALRDFREIGDYIAQGDRAAAISFVRRLHQRCMTLTDYPGTGRKRDEFLPNLRSVTEGEYVIFYRPLSEIVEVLHIVHGARDTRKLFKTAKTKKIAT